MPELVSIDGNVCVTLFSRKENVEKFCREKFCRDKYCGRHGWQAVRMSQLKTAGELRDFLVR